MPKRTVLFIESAELGQVSEPLAEDRIQDHFRVYGASLTLRKHCRKSLQRPGRSKFCQAGLHPLLEPQGARVLQVPPR